MILTTNELQPLVLDKSVPADLQAGPSVCPSVRLFVRVSVSLSFRPSLRPSLRPFVRHAFDNNKENRGFRL